MRLFLHRLRNDRSLQRIVFPIAAVLFASFVAAIVLDFAAERQGSVLERAERRSSRGELLEAEALYSAAMESGPVDLAVVVAFIDNRAALREALVMEAMSGRQCIMEIRAPVWLYG